MTDYTRYSDYTRYLASRTLSMLAIQTQGIAIAWEVYEMTGRPLALGYVGLAQFLPMILLWPVTGHVADRFDRRSVVLACQAVYGVCAALFLARTLGLLPFHGSFLVYSLLALVGTARAFNGPASQALLPDLVSKEQFSKAVAWSSSLWQAAIIAGPSLGGLLLLRGAAFVYGTTLALQILVVGLVVTMRVRTGRLEKKAASLETLLAGVRYTWQRKPVLGSISLDLFAVLFGGAIALLPVYARDILHAGPFGFGILRAAPGVGATSMAIVLALRPLKRRAGLWMFASVAVFGITTIVFGISHSLPLSLVMLALGGAGDMVSVVVRGTLVQIMTPPEMRGRVSAVSSVFIGASNELGEFESGLMAEWFGTVNSVAIGGIGTCVVVILWMILFPGLRRVDRLDGAV